MQRNADVCPHDQDDREWPFLPSHGRRAITFGLPPGEYVMPGLDPGIHGLQRVT